MAESDLHNHELPLESVGARLRRSREKADLTLGDIASRTKIAERHLASIEESRFGDLASRTYAVGFARAYAREVGLDEGQVAQAVRDELAETDRAREAAKADAFEPGDPARVPGSGIALVAGICAVVAIALVAIFWRSFFSPAGSLPELAADNQAVVAAPAASPSAAAAAATAPNGPVVFTALAPNIWVKFYDAAGNQLMQKQLALGESYTVPADANGPMIRTARPDALRITVGGRNVPRLADDAVIIADVPVSAPALLARAAPAPTPPPASPPANPGMAGPEAGHAAAAPVPHQTAVAAPAAAARPSGAPGPKASATIAPAAPHPPASASPASSGIRPEQAVAADRPPAPSPAAQPAAVEAETSTVSQ